jgi:DNA-binding HxlR family transcriptional regulator
MRRTRFDDAHCPVARTSDLIGDWWTPLVLRELFLGRHRFNDIQERTGMSRAILSERLKRLAAEAVVERVQYDDSPPRHEYRLTDKGLGLWDVIAAMWRFGDDWLFDESPGATVELVDQRTGAQIRPAMIDEVTGEALDLATTRIRLRSR